MKLKTIIDEDYNDYKLPSLFLAFPRCSFKCDSDCGEQVCQNSTLALSPDKDYDIDYIKKVWSTNPITQALVCGGLEPFDTQDALHDLVKAFRSVFDNSIIIYTGYTETEVTERFRWVYDYPNIIIKFGRFIPNNESHIDSLLGVKLMSPNQYAKKIT
jgi:hypothetical protein